MNVSRETSAESLSRSGRSIPDVSRETSIRLERYASLILKWNPRINLISRADEKRLWERHVLDSLQLVDLLPRHGSIIDLGSGGGFPGLVVAIATGRAVTLIEADARKVAFLRAAARETDAQATILMTRIEDAPPLLGDIITARALAPLPRLLELAAPLLAPGAICLFLKGASAGRELTDCQGAWNMVAERHQSRTDAQGCILRLSEVSRV